MRQGQIKKGRKSTVSTTVFSTPGRFVRQLLSLTLTALCCITLASCASHEKNSSYYSNSEIDRLQLTPAGLATPSDQTPSDQTPSDQTPSDQTPSDQTPSDQVEIDLSPRNLLRQRLRGLDFETGLLINTIPVNSPVLTELYAQNDFHPLWTNSRSIHQLFGVLEEIADDGLDAADYHYSKLMKLNNLLESVAAPPEDLIVDFDLLLSDSLTLLCHHLLTGKINSFELDDYSPATTKTSSATLSPAIIASAITQGSITELVADSRPRTATYARLRSALNRYRRIAAKGGWKEIPVGKVLKNGLRDKRVAALRERLSATADIVTKDLESIFFDAAVEAGVKRFQHRHTLPVDGVVGPVTLAALNQSVEEKIHRIHSNLERARWMARLPEKFVFVDIAGFQVQFFNNGASLFTARVQVGKSDRETPVFRSAITDLELNPTWTVPKTIFQQDILPEVKADPDYLQKKGLRIMSWRGKTIDAANIDWSMYPQHEFPYALRQAPGPKNAMGRIKFMFPNPYAIYLHDTPNRSLFNAKERAFSSGCVRIEQPLELAQLLLDDEKWDLNALKQMIQTQEKMRIHLKNPITVVLAYATVSVTENGDVIFRKDVYQQEKKILNRLSS